MKKVILYSILVLLIAALAYEGCKHIQVPSENFKVALDSLRKENDSLKVDLQKDADLIDSMYAVDVEAGFFIQELKGNIAAISKHTKSAKKVIATLSDPGLVTQFNQRYPADTMSDKLQVARPVLVSAAEDLIELDGAKETINTQDSIIVVSEARLTIKDSIISKYVNKETTYTRLIANKDSEIKTWTKEHLSIQLQNRRLQVKVKAQKIVIYIVAGALATVALLK